jgi:dynein intermediate chain, cytosolic
LKRLSRREKEREEELRQNLRREIEEELRSLKDPTQIDQNESAPQRFPTRALTNEEMDAVVSSEDFLDFVDRSSKVIERALDQEYDVLADYALDGIGEYDDDEEDEGYASSRGRKGRRLKEIAQFYDERWCKKRMISDINFSPKVCYATVCE